MVSTVLLPGSIWYTADVIPSTKKMLPAASIAMLSGVTFDATVVILPPVSILRSRR